MFKALLFDLDGVIVDTAIFHYKAWRKLSNDKFGYDISEEFNETLKGVSRGESIERIMRLGNVSISDSEKENLMTLKNQWYLDFISEMNASDILPGVIDILNQSKAANLKIGLGSVSKNAQFILEKVGIIHYFDAIIDGNKISNGKPHPEVFLNGALELGFEPLECIVLEDAIAGVQAGKAANMKVLGLGDSSILHEADLVLPSLEGVLLDNLVSRLS
jgi:beta-phosphoglucomutase